MTQSNLPEELRECPQCAELIKKKAKFCKHCKSDLTENSSPKSPTLNQSQPDSGAVFSGVFNILISSLVFGAIFYYFSPSFFSSISSGQAFSSKAPFALAEVRAVMGTSRIDKLGECPWEGETGEILFDVPGMTSTVTWNALVGALRANDQVGLREAQENDTVYRLKMGTQILMLERTLDSTMSCRIRVTSGPYKDREFLIPVLATFNKDKVKPQPAETAAAPAADITPKVVETEKSNVPSADTDSSNSTGSVTPAESSGTSTESDAPTSQPSASDALAPPPQTQQNPSSYAQQDTMPAPAPNYESNTTEGTSK